MSDHDVYYMNLEPTSWDGPWRLTLRPGGAVRVAVILCWRAIRAWLGGVMVRVELRGGLQLLDELDVDDLYWP